MRTLLVTGPGGSGRTTVAAATALAAAARGERVLLVGGALPELPEHPLLDVSHLDPDARFRAEIVALQERGSAVFDLLGARPLQAEELTAVPGAEQFALLRALRRAAASGAYDLLVADLPAVREAIDLLALPAQLRRYLRRLLPAERQAARSLRPVLAQLAGVPMPAQWLYETAARWHEELAEVQAVIEADTTAVRLVAEPGPAGADAVRAAVTALALHQLPLDLLVANRVLPAAPRLRRPVAGGPGRPAGRLPGRLGRRDLPVAELAHLGRDPRRPPTWPSSTPAPARPPPAPRGTSRTCAPPTGSWSGGSRCPASRRTGWTWSGAATNSSSRRDRSEGSFPCRPRCAAAPSPAPPCATAS